MSSPKPKEEEMHFKFPAHQEHMLSLAKMCQENKDYSDCVIQCLGDNSELSKIRAHRLVLGSASPFLKQVFQEVPASLSEASIVVPGVPPGTVQALIDFLYTGEMVIEREAAADMQKLVETLQIDPSLISVEEMLEQKSDKIEEDQPKPEENSESQDKSKTLSEDETESKESPAKQEDERSQRKRKLSNESNEEPESMAKTKRTDESNEEKDESFQT